MEKLEKLGKYEIRRELGRGAMGVVYEAFDPQIERAVAIKTILKSSVDKAEAEEAFSRFRREARAAGRLAHPKIVSIYEYGEDDEMAFIVMELIRGKELKDFFDREERFSIGDSIRIVMQILDALDFSHSRNVVHRDIKPANIMITEDGQIKIADFGIAKIDTSSLTQAGVVLGTPTYMSPEQFIGREVDHRTDIYSTGVLLYQFLTGERPFTGSVITIMHQAVHKEVPPPSRLNAGVSKQLDEVVQKAMAKKPEDRFQSAAEFMAALKAADKATLVSEHPTDDADKTLVEPRTVFDVKKSTLEPVTADSTNARRKVDVEAWQGITNSKNAEDFIRYLQEFPDGEFAELARMRLQSLEKLEQRAKEEEIQARLKKEAEARAARQERRRKEEEQRIALEKAQALAEEEARRKKQAEEKARLLRQLEEIKKGAVQERSLEDVKRKKESEELMRRAMEISLSVNERATKFTEVVSGREAEIEAERRMKLEARKKLEEEVQRRKQAKMQLLEKQDEADKAEAEAAAKRKREAAELAARNKELEEAHALAEAAERFRKEAEEHAVLAQRRARYTTLILGVITAALLIGALIAHFYPQTK